MFQVIIALYGFYQLYVLIRLAFIRKERFPHLSQKQFDEWIRLKRRYLAARVGATLGWSLFMMFLPVAYNSMLGMLLNVAYSYESYIIQVFLNISYLVGLGFLMVMITKRYEKTIRNMEKEWNIECKWQ